MVNITSYAIAGRKKKGKKRENPANLRDQDICGFERWYRGVLE